ATKNFGFVMFEPNTKVSESYIGATNYPCLVMINEQAIGEIKLAIADPAINMSLSSDHPIAKERRITLTLNGKFELKEESSSCRIKSSNEFKTEIEFTCIHGLSVEVNLLGILRTGVDQFEKAQMEPIIYPNPTDGIINIDVDQPIKFIQVLDNNGRIVHFSRISEKSILLSNLPNGVYYLRLVCVNNQSKTMKIIKMN
ncbi:MAG: T9SS type A sorting domain-containing protein, partial [Carboxylicivirga sp.]|nr:T9SS type A sorting domain-containing protein [Carboxylicivirga sp.]